MRRVVLTTLVVLLVFGLVFAEQVLRVGAAEWMYKKFPIEETAKRFEAAHPGVKVKLLKVTEFDQSMLMAMKAGRTNYDLLMPYSGGSMVKFIKLDTIVPLDDVFNNPKYKVDGRLLQRSDFLQGFLKSGIYDGKVYALPVFGEVQVLGYRKDYLEEAGVEPPKTWAELEMAARLLTKDNDGDGETDVYGYSTCWSRITLLYTFFSAVKARGGRLLDENGNLSFRDPITIDTLKWFVKMRNEYKAAQPDVHEVYNNSRDAFKAGKVALFHNWHSWCLESGLVFGPEKLGIVPLPKTGETGTMIYMGGVIVPKAGNVELAKQFIVEMIESKWFQQWSYLNYGKMPVTRQNLEGLEGDYWDELISAVD
ncbi:MAG TPA: hypothetical protein DHV12_07810, partial [Thermotogae bacterium]|nr:hypothetical protein [Thermotogota bacterium]